MVIRSKSRIDEHDYQRITISAFQTFWNVCIKELENYSKFNSWCDKCTIECQNIGKKTTLMWNFLLIQSSDWCCKTQLFLWQLIRKVVCYLLSDLWSLDDPMEKVAKRTDRFRMRGASMMQKWKENEWFTWNLIFGKNLSKHWEYLSLWYHYFPMI